MASSTAASSRTASPAHHGLSPHEVMLLLETDAEHGLTGAEAAARLDRSGPNLLPHAARGGLLRRALSQFHNPLVYILIAAGVVTALLGEYVDSSVIFGVVLVNAVLGFLQESKAEAALDALRSMTHTQARVIRDGREQLVSSERLVTGDLVLIEAGDKVPADLRLTRLNELRVDESALTGESLPVAKDEVALPAATPVADRRNMLYSGTLVTAGTGGGVVVATGAETEIGQIHRLVGSADALATPLTRKLGRFSKVLTVAILALAAATFAVGLVRGDPAVQTFTAAVALAVGAIPEGLPAAVTITLAIGVGRMARRRAVIRRLPAVETLGSTTVICSDKTGTLTENQMTVRAIWTPDGEFELTGTGYAPDGELRRAGQTNPSASPAPIQSPNGLDGRLGPALRWTLLVGAGCNDATVCRQDDRWKLIGDPTEGALLVVAAKAGLSKDRVRAQYPRVATIPFSSQRRYMATLHRDGGTDRHVVLVKGAVEAVLELCTGEMAADGRTAPLRRAAVLAMVDQYARSGLRVLATAVRTDAHPDEFTEERLGGLALAGLQAMLDPPRPAAASAVRACHSAGITVKMITGDHAATAAAIAGQLGLLDETGRLDGTAEGQVLTGEQLAALPPGGYPEAVDRARVFARVSPEQKLHLVEALQQRGHVVAMTGDGVNDAPALRQANIGIAMGRGGTEAAKEAADMVLTDDEFATIEAAVEEGRGVFDNLTKFITWTLPTNFAEGLVILVAIVIGAALPILPTQILWINMTTAVLLGLMLAFEPKEPKIMGRPPRDPAQPLLTTPLLVRILLVSTLLVAGSWWLFRWELAHGASLAEARTAAVNLFVVVQAFYLFSCRSLVRAPWRLGLFSNRWIIVGVTAQLLGQLLITYLPAMNTVFGTEPIGVAVWLRILAIAVAAAAIVAMEKSLWRRSRLPSAPRGVSAPD